LTKVDLLVGPLGQFRERLRVKGVCARPTGTIKLHAHTVEEAIHIDESPVSVTISGTRSDGKPAEAQVHVPQAFTYLMMKLFAFRDRKEDEDKHLGRHHALDLYTIVAMQVESDHHLPRPRLAATVVWMPSMPGRRLCFTAPAFVAFW
jgi:hypothetical protein